MFDILVSMFSYSYGIRAIVVGILVALCASLLGVSLILKKYAMVGDGLSHVGFGSLAIATALNVAPLEVSLPIMIVVAFILLKISENSKIKGDSAIALISTSALAIGVVVISLTSGMSIDVYNYMFGSILAISQSDMILCIILSVIVITLFILFYNRIFAVTFDENSAKAMGVRTNYYNMLIAILTAVTIVIGMKLMGALLISGLLIFPALSSMRVFKKFKSVVISSAIISVACVFIGIYLSFAFNNLATGACIVCVNLVVFFVCWLIAFIKQKVELNKRKKQVVLENKQE